MQVETKITSFEKKKGCWNCQKVEIIIDGEKRGEYEYMYCGRVPFYAFERPNGDWYALYATNYTATRLMKLPECEDYCGEESSGVGFCPVEFWVPSKKYLTDEYGDFCFPEEKAQAEAKGEKDNLDVINLAGRIGFMQGCVWGDDTCWKLRIINLDKTIEEKRIVLNEPMDYIELQDGDLQDLIDFYHFDLEDDYPMINVSTRRQPINVASALNLKQKD